MYHPQVMKEYWTVIKMSEHPFLCPAVIQEEKLKHRKWRHQTVVLMNMIVVHVAPDSSDAPIPASLSSTLTMKARYG